MKRALTNKFSPNRSNLLMHYGAIGNGHLVALVAPNTSIDWLCMPRFDSASIFAGLLDPERGGAFRFEFADSSAIAGNLRYVRNTNVLYNRIILPEAAFDIFDFCPRIVRGLEVERPCELVRLVVPKHGQPRLRLIFDPRPNYGEGTVALNAANSGIKISAITDSFMLYSNVPADYLLNNAEFVLDRPCFFVLRYGCDGDRPDLTSVNSALDLTIRGWQAWAKTCALPSFHATDVLRSALCLKLHIYEETGAIIASATTSIPEALGTERTWDYRYCWLRDSVFVVEALRRLSHLQEGEKFVLYLRDIAEAGPLQPVYGIGGERMLNERILSHLSGFQGCGPVRVGNAAFQQVQNDVVGEMLLCLDLLFSDPRVLIDKPWEYVPLIEALVKEAAEIIDKPDTGIWEYRSALKHYTFSRAMCWAGLDRGASLLARLGSTEAAIFWKKRAEQEREKTLQSGFNSELGMFTQLLHGQYADSANLLLAAIGLISPTDPRFQSTVRKFEELLLENGLLLRYRHPDDFGDTTSAFTICSFWLVEALAISGRLDDAIVLFEKLIGYSNSLGLFSEDIDPNTGQLLGNFPQAYTHVGLINAATTIGKLLDARDGRVHSWVRPIR